MSTVGDLATLSYSTDSGSTYTPFAEVKEINGNKITAPEVKTTSLADAAETSQPGKPDHGEISCKIEFLKTITSTILGWMTNRTVIMIKLTADDGATDSDNEVSCWVKEFDPFGTLKDNELVISTITFRVTGAGAFTAGS
jgi:hypothetical protein